VIDNTLTLKQIRCLQFILITVGSLLLVSCGSYKQNIMFRIPEGTPLPQQIAAAEKNYVILKNDVLQLDVFTNKGERIIDPGAELSKDAGQKPEAKEPLTYIVDIRGVAKFPLVGELKIDGLTIRQTEEILQKEFAKYYQDPFVILKVSSWRVFVLGAPGGQVIPLTHENTTLVEVLAMAKGVDKNARAHNIRVIRGEQFFVADFTTFDGYKKSNMILESGDIVYIEPIRKPFTEGVQEYGPLISVITSLATLIVVLTQANN
jgi:polysaccharide export outer membrane protein